MDRKFPRRPITTAIDQALDKVNDRPPTSITNKPAGKSTRLVKAIRERAAVTGLLPHEILLSIARGEPFHQRMLNPVTGEVTVKEIYPDIHMVADAAAKGAPYFAPKMSAVQVIPGATDEELDEFIARAAAEAGVVVGAVGEAEEEEGEGGEGSDA